MSVQPIRLFGDPVLRTRAHEVTTFDLELRKLVADLVDTMHEEGGAGLAAPQLGVGLRVFSYSCDGFEGHLINPTFDVVGDEEQLGPEGCLSIPGLSWDCRRHLHVLARGWDQHGEPVTVEGSELLARCIQHETDHLDGVLFVDRLDPAVRKLAMAEIRAAEWFGADPAVRSANPPPPAFAPTGPASPRSASPRSASPRSASTRPASTRSATIPGPLAGAPTIKVSPHPMFGKAR